MEAVGAAGAAASVFAVVELVGRVSALAASFMRGVRDARRDMIQVRKNMSDLSTVLEMVAEDLEKEGDSALGDMSHSQRHIVDIAHGCCAVLLEIEAVIREGQSRLRWVLSGKERVNKLRERLETYKLSLDVALDYRTMVVVQDIKKDSTQIVGDISAIRSNMELLIAKVGKIERQVSRGQDSLGGVDPAGGGVMLDRFLNECRSDAQTVLDNIEYQQDPDFEDFPRQVQVEAWGLENSSPPPTIVLKNCLGHRFKIPLEVCTPWVDMERMIKQSYPRQDGRREIGKGQYSIYHEGQAIPPELWAESVGPGKKFEVKLWKSETIKFKDAIGRKFNFPFHLVQTWKGIEELVEEAFRHVKALGPLHYDLIGPDDKIIGPAEWEQIIRPGMSITMRMRPLAAVQAGEHQKQRKTRPGDSTSKQEQLRRATGLPTQGGKGGTPKSKSRKTYRYKLWGREFGTFERITST